MSSPPTGAVDAHLEWLNSVPLLGSDVSLDVLHRNVLIGGDDELDGLLDLLVDDGPLFGAAAAPLSGGDGPEGTRGPWAAAAAAAAPCGQAPALAAVPAAAAVSGLVRGPPSSQAEQQGPGAGGLLYALDGLHHAAGGSAPPGHQQQQQQPGGAGPTAAPGVPGIKVEREPISFAHASALAAAAQAQMNAAAGEHAAAARVSLTRAVSAASAQLQAAAAAAAAGATHATAQQWGALAGLAGLPFNAAAQPAAAPAAAPPPFAAPAAPLPQLAALPGGELPMAGAQPFAPAAAAQPLAPPPALGNFQGVMLTPAGPATGVAIGSNLVAWMQGLQQFASHQQEAQDRKQKHRRKDKVAVLQAEVATLQAQLQSLSLEHMALSAKARALDQLVASAGDDVSLMEEQLAKLDLRSDSKAESEEAAAAAAAAVAALQGESDWQPQQLLQRQQQKQRSPGQQQQQQQQRSPDDPLSHSPGSSVQTTPLLQLQRQLQQQKEAQQQQQQQQQKHVQAQFPPQQQQRPQANSFTQQLAPSGRGGGASALPPPPAPREQQGRPLFGYQQLHEQGLQHLMATPLESLEDILRSPGTQQSPSPQHSLQPPADGGPQSLRQASCGSSGQVTGTTAGTGECLSTCSGSEGNGANAAATSSFTSPPRPGVHLYGTAAAAVAAVEAAAERGHAGLVVAGGEVFEAAVGYHVPVPRSLEEKLPEIQALHKRVVVQLMPLLLQVQQEQLALQQQWLAAAASQQPLGGAATAALQAQQQLLPPLPLPPLPPGLVREGQTPAMQQLLTLMLDYSRELHTFAITNRVSTQQLYTLNIETGVLGVPPPAGHWRKVGLLLKDRLSPQALADLCVARQLYSSGVMRVKQQRQLLVLQLSQVLGRYLGMEHYRTDVVFHGAAGPHCEGAALLDAIDSNLRKEYTLEGVFQWMTHTIIPMHVLAEMVVHSYPYKADIHSTLQELTREQPMPALTALQQLQLQQLKEQQAALLAQQQAAALLVQQTQAASMMPPVLPPPPQQAQAFSLM